MTNIYNEQQVIYITFMWVMKAIIKLYKKLKHVYGLQYFFVLSYCIHVT